MPNSRIPEPCCRFAHRQPIQLRFNDADMFGHVNNAVYFQYFDLAKFEFFRQLMGPDFDPHGIALVVVNVNTDFYAPVLLTETVSVLTGVVRIGEKSLTLEQRLVSEEDGAIKCVCTTVMAGFDPRTMTSAPIADIWRERLESAMNHSGRP